MNCALLKDAAMDYSVRTRSDGLLGRTRIVCSDGLLGRTRG